MTDDDRSISMGSYTMSLGGASAENLEHAAGQQICDNPEIVEEIRDIFRQLDPVAREHLGKSILDCDAEDRAELFRRLAAGRTANLAALDQLESALRNLVGPETADEMLRRGREVRRR